MRRRAGAAALFAAAAASGCGGGGAPAALPPDAVPLPAGRGPLYRLPARGAAVAAGRSVGSLRCLRRASPRFGMHVELIVTRRVVLLPAGVGVSPRRRCSYPLRTGAPTGLVEVRPGTLRALGDLFSLWSQPLGSRRLAGFHAPPGRAVEAFLDGRRWLSDPRAIPLRRHAVIVLELGEHVVPHARYVFPPGL